MDEPTDNSSIKAISERIRECQATSAAVANNMSDELSRIFGPMPTANGEGPNAQPCADGVIGELDDLVTTLTKTLDRIRAHAQRLSSI